MNFTPATVARLLDTNSAGDRRNFITPEIVAQVVETRKDTYGSYLICGWPTMDQQRLIHQLAVAAQDSHERADGFKSGVSQGFRHGADWDGLGQPWGDAYAAGCDFGRFFRLDDSRAILA